MSLYRRVPIAGAIATVGASLALIACGPSNPQPNTCVESCDLAPLAVARGLTVGAAVTANGLRDPAYATAVARHFTSITPEFDLKWRVVHPAVDTWSWTNGDAIVAFAEAHHLSVRGHTLLWGKNGVNPSWLTAMTDPVAFRAAVLGGITTEISHYAGRIDRWDVVNEPLAKAGADLDHNMFWDRIGPDYIDLAFRTAHAADPSASLWLNEAGLERGGARADAFVALVGSLLARGVPIDGVGIQGHLLTPDPLAAGSLASLIGRLRLLGVRVAVTELDVPTGPTRTSSAQVAAYAQVADECLGAGCTELTTWGVSDSATWLDDPDTRADLPVLDQYATPSDPLLLDHTFQAKAAYRAVADRIRAVTPIR